jgi:hypothetical protein
MKKKSLLLGMLLVVLVFGMTVVSCDDGQDNKVIDSKFRGKWETHSFQYGGATYTLPLTYNGVTINSAGFEIKETSVKSYGNGTVMSNTNGIYSDGNSFYNTAGQSGFTMQVTGDNATIILASGETDYCTKVTKFSWE